MTLFKLPLFPSASCGKLSMDMTFPCGCATPKAGLLPELFGALAKVLLL
jgi:hypothetical protein